MIGLEDQNKLFAFLGEKLKKKIEFYVIGGSAMLYYGMKDVTKDIDIVFDNEKDKEEVEKLLRNLGYKEKATKILYFKKKNIPTMLEREEARFDIFLNEIIDVKLTSNIKERVKSIYEFSNLIVKVIAPEDIILMKCATERPGDRIDAAEILKKSNINWNTIIEESIHQTKIGELLFPVFLYDFLYELKEDLKANIPEKVIDELRKISEDVLEEDLKKKKK